MSNQILIAPQQKNSHPFLNRFVRLSFVVGLLLSFGVQATTQDVQRKAFLKLEDLAKSGKLRANDPRLTELSAYPLYRYLEYHRIIAGASALRIEDVERFRAQFPDSHLERMLRTRLTRSLADQSDWKNFIVYYQDLEGPGAEMDCYYAQAQIDTGDKRAGQRLATELWQAGESQPKACDASFNLLQASNSITSEMALNRSLNAADSGNLGLMKYAMRFVTDTADKAVVEQARAIYESPDKIIALSKRPGKLKPYLARLQHLAINRAYRRSSANAFALLIALGDDLLRSEANLKQIERVGVRIAKDLEPEIEKQLAELDANFDAPGLTEWRIRLALYDQNWKLASRYIQKLPQNLRDGDRWRYWQSVTQSKLDKALPEFNELQSERSFYGFLAAEHTDRGFSLNQQSPLFTDNIYQPLSESEQMARIKELIALDRYSVARSEWNQWKEQLDPQQRQAVAHLMRDIEWYQQGILTAAYEGLWNDLKLRFPTVFMEHFAEQAKLREIDPIWALAISRQESALFPWAQSSAGARGLMQLMPKTASQTAKQEGISYRGTESLYEPAINISLGTAYLAQMYKRFEGNRAYASAAYNAGPHRVSRWLEKGSSLPLDIWIETIPFDETRTYVQNVLSFALIYGELNNQPKGLLNTKERSQLRVTRR